MLGHQVLWYYDTIAESKPSNNEILCVCVCFGEWKESIAVVGGGGGAISLFTHSYKEYFLAFRLLETPFYSQFSIFWCLTNQFCKKRM